MSKFDDCKVLNLMQTNVKRCEYKKVFTASCVYIDEESGKQFESISHHTSRSKALFYLNVLKMRVLDKVKCAHENKLRGFNR